MEINADSTDMSNGQEAGNPMLFDMHCHLDFADNAKTVAADARNARIAALSATVTPSSFVSACGKFAGFPNINVALGLHPWWVADNQVSEADLERFEALAQTTRFIGEIGLDFHGERKKSRARQEEAFSRALYACNAANAAGRDEKASSNSKVIFIHAVHATTRTLDILDEHNTFSRNAVVFHWFQGSEEEFGRALAAGALFSVNMRMLANERTRRFAQAIPDERLLLETDNPPHAGMAFSTDIWRQELENTLLGLAELRDIPPQDLADLLASNSEECLA